MEKMQNLQDLLKHEIEDLYSAEDQITSALPKMIEKARNAKLKQGLTQHLRVTEEQIRRLDKIKELLNQNKEGEGERKGFLSGLFGGGNHKCRGMEGLIEEGEKIMREDMDPDVMDAAIIASAQKIEHYEICGYGTARAFARELKLTQVERLLTETLNEEYESDDKLTSLAVVGGLNEEAKDRSKRRSSKGQGNSSGARASKTASKSSSGGSKSASKSSGRGGSKPASKPSRGGSKSASKSSSRSASKAGSKTASKGGRSKAASKGGRSKAASKGGRKTASKGRR